MAEKQDRVQMTMVIDGKQAINQLGQLEMEANELKRAMKDNKRGTEEYIKASKRMKEVKSQISEVRKEIGITGMTMGQLRKYQRELTNEMTYGTTRGTKRYKELNAELKQVNAQINKQRADVKQLGGAWSSVKGSFSQFGPTALVVTGITAAIAAVPKWISANVTLSDSLTDVQKYTDLTNQELEVLMGNLESMNTRSSRAELMSLAEVAGRLGIKGVEDITGFVRAADQINVALSEDLGGNVEEALKALGKITSTYRIKDVYGIEDSLLKVGSAINTLGASSEANEGYIVDFTNRMGGIAPLAGISIENILGLGATLDSLGQTSEVSSTALSKIFTDMAKRSKEFAKVANMEVGSFVELLEKDANEALIKVLEGVKNNADGIPNLTKALGDLGQDGGRVIGVLGTLANNVDVLRKQQEIANRSFAEGTSITEEFTKKNENLAATLEKIGNYLTNKFVTSSFVKGLENIANKVAAIILPAETATEAFRKQQDRVNSLERDITPLADRYDELTSKSELSTAEQNELNNIIKTLASNVPTAVTAFDEYGNAIGISTEKIDEFLKRQRAMLEYQNQEAIAEATADLEEYEKQIRRISMALSQRDEDGDLYQIITGSSAGVYTRTRIKLTAEEIRNLQDELDAMQSKADGARNTIASLRGINPFEDLTGDNEQEEEVQVIPPVDTSEASNERDREFERLLKQWEDFNKKLADQKEAFRISQLEKDQQEIAQIEAKYEQLHNQNRDFLNQKVIDQATYNAVESELLAQQDAELDALFAARNEKHRQDKEAFQQQIDNMLMSEQEREIAKVEEHYDKLIELAKQYGLDITSLEELKAAEISEIRQQAREKELDQEIEALRLQGETYTQFGNLMAATNEFIGKSGEEMTDFQRALILVQIALDTAAAMSSAMAGALAAAEATGPGAVITTPLFIAEMFALVIGAAAKVKAAFGDAGKTPKAPSAKTAPTVSFYDGGDTGRGRGLGYGDQYGEYAGYVHFGEYVVPSYLRRDPVVVDAERYIEARRKGRSFFDGGPTGDRPPVSTTPPTAPPAIDNKKLDLLIEETRLTRQELQKAQDKRVVLSYRDLDEMKEKYEKVKLKSRL